MYEKLLSETFPGFLSIRNKQHQIIYLNDNFKNWIARYCDVDPIGKTNVELAKIVPANVADTFLQCHDGSLDLYSRSHNKKGLKKVIEFKGDDGKPESSEYFDVLKYIVKVNGEPYIYTIAYDITDIFKENQFNLYSAMIDSMTGAYNRRYLNKNFQQFCGHPAILVDLDNFKLINDYEGHAIGDMILCEIVMLLNQIPGAITVIRLGGDEFVTIFEVGMSKEDIFDLVDKARKDFETMYKEYHYLSFSYGSDIIRQNVETTLMALDKTLYEDKFQRKALYKDYHIDRK